MKSIAGQLDGITVLVVEDDADMSTLLVRTLEQMGAEVGAYATVPEALEGLNCWIPDVLIVDIGLPDYNGYAFIARVRQASERRTRGVPAIALTAYSTAADRDTALTSGFQAFLTKPFDIAVLVDTISKLSHSKPAGQNPNSEKTL